MPLVIEMKPSEATIIKTKSGDEVRIELPRNTSRRCKIVFFAEDNIEIIRIKKEVAIENNERRVYNTTRNSNNSEAF